MFLKYKVFDESLMDDPEEIENRKSSPSSRDNDWDGDDWKGKELENYM